MRRHEHRAPASGCRSPCPARSCPATGGSSGPRRWAWSATACSAPATSCASPPTPTGSSSCPPRPPLGAALVDLYGDIVLDVDVKPNRGDALSIVGPRPGGRGHHRRARPLPGHRGRGVAGRRGRAARRRRSEDTAALPAVRRALGQRRRRSALAGPRPDAPAGRRHAADQQRRRCQQLRDAGAGQADPHVRRRGRPPTAGRIVVRRAAPGERLETLDHVDRELDRRHPRHRRRQRAARRSPGSWAGPTSEVGDATTDVIVESAIFDPVSIRRTGLPLRPALGGQPALREGPGVRASPASAQTGAPRLIAEWAGGASPAGRVDTAPPGAGRAARRLPPGPGQPTAGDGLSTDAEQAGLLGPRRRSATGPRRRHASVVVAGGDAARSPCRGRGRRPGRPIVPTWRRDLAIEADIAEEVARVARLRRGPAKLPDTPMPHFRPDPLELRDALRRALAGAGLTEVVTLALVSAGAGGPPRLADRRPPTACPATQPWPATDHASRTRCRAQHSVLRQSWSAACWTSCRQPAPRARATSRSSRSARATGAPGTATPAEWWRLAFALTGAADARAGTVTAGRTISMTRRVWSSCSRRAARAAPIRSGPPRRRRAPPSGPRGARRRLRAGGALAGRSARSTQRPGRAGSSAPIA